MNADYDIIVIGLGAMGSAALYQLARRGVPALGIDQFAPPHQMGSTHGETRITRLAVGEEAVQLGTEVAGENDDIDRANQVGEDSGRDEVSGVGRDRSDVAELQFSSLRRSRRTRAPTREWPLCEC